jgi:hypothetical protein
MAIRFNEKCPVWTEVDMAKDGKKQSSPKVSTLAAQVLSGSKKPTAPQVRTLAASVLGQDEKRGQKK